MWKWLNPVKYPNKSGSSKERFNWVKWILISLGVLLVAGTLLLLQPWVFLPHKHIEISLPFPPEADSYTDLIPMGEIEQYHNASTGNPNGHPGIDFGWEKETNILAVADGRIINIRKNHDGQYIVEQSLGYYRTVYQELNKLEPDIRIALELKKGQVIGQTGRPHVEGQDAPKPADPSRQIHWDFASSSMVIGRLCPLGYFDSESKKRIEAIWAKMKARGHFKQEYPDICNGYFKGKEK